MWEINLGLINNFTCTINLRKRVRSKSWKHFSSQVSVVYEGKNTNCLFHCVLLCVGVCVIDELSTLCHVALWVDNFFTNNIQTIFHMFV